MYDGIPEIQEFLLVDIAPLPGEKSGDRPNLRRLDKRIFHHVYFSLRTSAHIHIAVTARTSLYGVQGIKHIGVKAVVIESTLCIVLLIFRGVKHHILHIFAVLQGVFAVYILMIIDLDNRCLICRVNGIIIKKLGVYHGIAFQLIPKLRVTLAQQVFIHQFRVEEETAHLNIRNPWLPVQVQQVHPFNSNITQSVELGLVPQNLVDTGAGFHFLPHYIGVCLFKVILFQNTGDDGGQFLRLRPISHLPGKDVRLRVGFHCICVLGHNHIVQPAGFAGETSIGSNGTFLLLLHCIAQLPPILACNDTAFGVRKCSLVLFQHICELPQLLLSNGISIGSVQNIRFVIHTYLLLNISSLSIGKLVKGIRYNRLRLDVHNGADRPGHTHISHFVGAMVFQLGV